MWVTLVLTGKVARKARTHTQTFPLGLVVIDTITYSTKKTRPAQSNFLKVRGQRNKIASIRSLNSQWKDSQGCTESNEYQFCCNIIYLLGENTLQLSGSNERKRKVQGRKQIEERGLFSSNTCVSRSSFLFSILLWEAWQKWRWSWWCCWAPSWARLPCLPIALPVTRGSSRSTAVTASPRARRTSGTSMMVCEITSGKGRAVRWSVTATWMNCFAAQSKITVISCKLV